MNTNTVLAEELKDIRDVKIDLSMPIDKRRKSFMEQIKNPYQFKYKDTIVTLEFSGETTLEDKLIAHINNI